MNHNNMKYQETGNRVPVSVEELVKYIQSKLYAFDELLEVTRKPPSYNPYKEPIYYTTKAGKTIMIPKEIQEKAIEEWRQRKGQYHVFPMAQEQEQPQIQEQKQMPVFEIPKMPGMPQMPIPMIPQLPKQEMYPQKKQGKTVYVVEQKKDYWKMILLIVASTLAIYVAYKLFFSKKSSESFKTNTNINTNVNANVVPKSIKYFLTRD
jgi:hypothetical protein